jgi:hypothetical protein
VELFDYERLAFGDEPASDVDEVWEALAKAVARGLPRGTAFVEAGRIAGEGAGEALEGGQLFGFDLSPEMIATHFKSASAEAGPEHAERVASELRLIGQRLGDLPPAARREIKQRLGSFVTNLSPDLQKQLFRISPERGEQGFRFLAEMANLLPQQVIIDVLDDLQGSGDHVPHQLFTLFGKLSGLRQERETDVPASVKKGPDSPAALSSADGRDIKDVLREVFTERSKAQHNPDAYQGLLEDIAEESGKVRATIRFDERYRDPQDPAELRASTAVIAARLLLDDSVCEEAPVLVDHVSGAAMELLRGGRFEELLEVVAAVRRVADSGEPDDEARRSAESFLGLIESPETIDLLLAACETVTENSVRAYRKLFAMTGAEGVVRALETLPTLPPGTGREMRIGLLAYCDPEAIVGAFKRIAAEEAETLSAVVPVLRRLDARLAINIARTLSSHSHPDIRIEAYRVLAKVDRREGAFDRCLEAALWDPEVRVGKFALDLIEGRAGANSCTILSRYIAGEIGVRNESLHRRAVAVLSRIPTDAARDALIRILLCSPLSFRSSEMRMRVAAERALLTRTDLVSRRALVKWQRSLAYWISLLIVRRSK